MKLLAKADPADRRSLGQRINALQDELTAVVEQRKAAVEAEIAGRRDRIDVTEPGRRPAVGARHPILKTADELAELFARMGFRVAGGPELEDEFHNFVALNIPETHPAREPADNFYLADEPTFAGQTEAAADRPAAHPPHADQHGAGPRHDELSRRRSASSSPAASTGRTRTTRRT